MERYIPGRVWYDWFESGGSFYSEGKVFELDAPFHTIPGEVGLYQLRQLIQLLLKGKLNSLTTIFRVWIPDHDTHFKELILFDT